MISVLSDYVHLEPEDGSMRPKNVAYFIIKSINKFVNIVVSDCDTNLLFVLSCKYP
jgi:hypothetical protein